MCVCVKILIFKLKNLKNRICLTVNKNIYFKLCILYIRNFIFVFTLSLCMYVCMYVCMYISMYIYIYIYMYT